MSKSNYTLNVIGLGGAGANLLVDISNKLKESIGLSEGSPSVNLFHVDTSIANRSVSKTVGAKFYQVTHNDVDGKALQGSGGVRSANVKETQASIKMFVNDNLDLFNDKSINVLVSSASGGSGSILNPLLSQKMAELDVPTVIVLIGDDRNLTYAINTSDTIKTFHGMAVKYDTVRCVHYYNNGDTIKDNINNSVADFVSILALFYDVTNIGMDAADMHAFINPTNRYILCVLRPWRRRQQRCSSYSQELSFGVF